MKFYWFFVALLLGGLLGLCVGTAIGEKVAFLNLGLMLKDSTINVDVDEKYIMDRTEIMVNQSVDRMVASLNITNSSQRGLIK